MNGNALAVPHPIHHFHVCLASLPHAVCGASDIESWFIREEWIGCLPQNSLCPRCLAILRLSRLVPEFPESPVLAPVAAGSGSETVHDRLDLQGSSRLSGGNVSRGELPPGG